MTRRSNPDPDHPQQPPQGTPSAPPREREERRENERKLGDDPAQEGPDNESLPEGSAKKGRATLHVPEGRRRPAQSDTPETRDRRGDGSVMPSNVRREKRRA